MCLIALAYNPSPALRLVVAANRDEFHGRPSLPLAVWANQPDVIAGRDVEAQGTWLGLSRRGRLAAVTNVRLPGMPAPGLRSRGALALDFLAGDASPQVHLAALDAAFDSYGPCNLLLADAHEAWHASNRPGIAAQKLGDGVHGLSNATLDTPWPKTVQLKAAVETWLATGRGGDTAPLFSALADDHQPADAELPDTGVGLARERFVAPAFIRGREYGTRCSTVIVVDAEGRGTVIERRFGPEGLLLGESRVGFDWPAS
ncbi:MAG: NRDE family protein [Pseudomonadota bacterium]